MLSTAASVSPTHFAKTRLRILEALLTIPSTASSVRFEHAVRSSMRRCSKGRESMRGGYWGMAKGVLLGNGFGPDGGVSLGGAGKPASLRSEQWESLNSRMWMECVHKSLTEASVTC